MNAPTDTVLSSADEELAQARREIDQIDDQIHDLLMARVEVVARVARAKGANGAPDGGKAAVNPMRVEREAQLLRRLHGRHKGALPFAAIANLWRELFGATTSLQAPFSIVVSGGEGALARWDLARAQFGSSTAMSLVEDARSAVRQVAEGQASVAVVPPPGDADEGMNPWWTQLSAAEGSPRIVNALPFVVAHQPDMPVRRRFLNADAARAVVVSRTPFAASGEDVTLMVGMSPATVSPDTVEATFEKAGLAGWRLAVAADPHGGGETDRGAGKPQLNVIAFDGYLAADDKRLHAALKRNGGPFSEIYPVGGYPVPVEV